MTQNRLLLAGLLVRGPHVIVIPGTTSLAHREENAAAAALLSAADLALLSPP